MKCKNCGERLEQASLAMFWREYHVGGYPSDDTFCHCPDCVTDDSVDPKDMLEVTVVEVEP